LNQRVVPSWLAIVIRVQMFDANPATLLGIHSQRLRRQPALRPLRTCFAAYHARFEAVTVAASPKIALGVPYKNLLAKHAQ
jgi:hypothetical protein